MSEVYINEPSIRGKVVIHTSEGELDVELWSKECPKAVRNFVQLCLEGYYEGCEFFRVIRGFLVQTGDPLNTGEGGESIYGEDFPIEIHSRLKFRYRGLVGTASSKNGLNGSQFFMTLDKADTLNGKYTLFGKITGPSFYNLLKIGEHQTNENNKPLNPIYILSTEVLWNPFDDIKPRVLKKNQNFEIPKIPKNDQKRTNLINKKTQLLSFDDEEDEFVNKKLKSAHDLLNDPNLLKEQTTYSTINYSNIKVDNEKPPPPEPANINIDMPIDNDEEIKEDKMNISKLPIEVSSSNLSLKKGKGSSSKYQNALESIQDGDLLTENQKKYQIRLQEKRNATRRKREEDVFNKFLKFNEKLKKITSTTKNVKKEEEIINNDESMFIKLDEKIDESDGTWLLGEGLKFSVDSQRAFDLDDTREALAVFDPLSKSDAKNAEKLFKQMRRKPQTLSSTKERW